MVDVVVIGAGLGGLMAAARLAGAGRRVVVLEKKALPGGTSYVFRRGGYAFPMGPLSFSFPGRVRALLADAGIAADVPFRRSGFEIRTPALDVVISRPLVDLEAELVRLYPGERAGLARFFAALRSAIAVSKDMDLWHPGFGGGGGPAGAGAGADARFFADRARAVADLAARPAAAVLQELVADRNLANLLGAMGSEAPAMSLLNLALMWNVMAGEGIWSPEPGVHVLADLLRERLAAAGGELRLATPVREITVRGGRASGVVTAAGEAIAADWVVSNADYKTTFLELVGERGAPGIDLGAIRGAPYTGSEICVYLGVRPEAVDLSAMRAEHLFYRHDLAAGGGPEDLEHRDIEICLWSRQAPGLVPAGRESLVLRASFPYEAFAPYRLGERKRAGGYAAYKRDLATRLVRTAEHVLPGLAGAIEVQEAATPLTYRDWGGRFEGSIAGWSWAARPDRGPAGGALVRTPVAGLLAAGAYASTELILGGVPTALSTGRLAADIILADA